MSPKVMPAIGMLAMLSNSGRPYIETGGNGMVSTVTTRARWSSDAGKELASLGNPVALAETLA